MNLVLFFGRGERAGGTGKSTPAKEILLLLGSMELGGLLVGAEVARKGTCAKLFFLSTPYWRREGKAGRAEDGEALERTKCTCQGWWKRCPVHDTSSCI